MSQETITNINTSIQDTKRNLSVEQIKRSKFLIFKLNHENFGLPLLQVKEIIGMVDIRPIPNVERHYKGLINLRGQIISVIDLRMKLGLNESDKSNLRPCIIISQVGDITLGSIVDEIIEVVGLEESEIETQIDTKGAISRDLMTGIARDKSGGLTILLDLSHLHPPKINQ